MKPYTKNEDGWTLFQYGDEPDTRAVKLSEKNCIALCGNTKLIKQTQKDGYIGFRVIGGNIQATATITKEIVYPHTANAKKVWMSKGNTKDFLTQQKPDNFDKAAKVIVEVDYRSMHLIFSKTKGGQLSQLIATLKYKPADSFLHKKIQITLNTGISHTPLPVGTYKILAPDFSHGITQDNEGNWGALASQYLSEYQEMKNYNVWFPIEYADPKTKRQDRYIHAGHISHGCVTIYDMNKWNDLYDYLISHRDPVNDKYIGEIEIKEKR